jgi:hypothetical protein
MYVGRMDGEMPVKRNADLTVRQRFTMELTTEFYADLDASSQFGYLPVPHVGGLSKKIIENATICTYSYSVKFSEKSKLPTGWSL